MRSEDRVEIEMPPYDQNKLDEVWERWNENQCAVPVSGLRRLEDYVYCLEHHCVHENNLSAREMAEIACWCEPENHQSIYIEKEQQD